MKIYCTADVGGYYDFICIEDYCPTNATLVIRINDEVVFNETYNQEFDLVRDFSFSDFNMTVSPFTYCKVNVTYSKGDEVYSTERMLYT